MKFVNWSGIDLELYLGDSNNEEPEATVNLRDKDSINIPENAFDTVLISKLKE